MAAAFAIWRKPVGLRRLVISNCSATLDMWNVSFLKLLGAFPRHVREAVSRGFADPKGLWAALQVVYAEHGCRVQPLPKEMEYTLLQIYGEDADRTVNDAK